MELKLFPAIIIQRGEDVLVFRLRAKRKSSTNIFGLVDFEAITPLFLFLFNIFIYCVTDSLGYKECVWLLVLALLASIGFEVLLMKRR